MKKVALVANSSWYLYNFRLSLMNRLRGAGYTLLLVAPEDEYSARLRELGFELRLVPLDRKGMNPFKDFLSIYALFKIYRAERPDVAHHHTVKCALYGSFAAALAGVPAVVNSITGLGHLFLSHSRVVKLARFALIRLYRRVSQRRGVHFLFQNPDDLAAFEKLGIVRPGHFTLVRGSGVDLTRFQPPVTERRLEAGQPVRVLFGSRLLKEKGLYELREACLALKKKKIAFEIVLAGKVDAGNPSSITTAEIEAWQAEGWMFWIGHVESMEATLRSVEIAVLPSWREGLPRFLLEAGAAGRALLATDVPGCREVVQNERTGLLVPLRDAGAIAEALERLILDADLRKRLGNEARAHVSREFGDDGVFLKTTTIYNSLLSQA